mmetsp:Transcript_12143/g.24696  ORF Transcript_12143/g.24696 Transcript_12143/m.24696 type:complete len:137 (-) Transcript_12143:194-604(-)
MSLPTPTAPSKHQERETPTPTPTSIAPGNSNHNSNHTTTEKVRIHFVAVGAAPILKKTRFRISADQRFASVHVFLRRVLKINRTSSSSSHGGDALFLYLHAAFCPGPEELLADLNEAFASKRGELVVHYSPQPAWG